MRIRELSGMGRLARFAHVAAVRGGDHAARPAHRAATGGAPGHRSPGPRDLVAAEAHLPGAALPPPRQDRPRGDPPGPRAPRPRRRPDGLGPLDPRYGRSVVPSRLLTGAGVAP